MVQRCYHELASPSNEAIEVSAGGFDRPVMQA